MSPLPAFSFRLGSLLVFMGLAFGVLFDRGGHRVPPVAFPDTLEAVAQNIFDQTNAERRAVDRRSLAPDPGLRALACRHTRDMLDRDFMGHVNPDGIGPNRRTARYHRSLIGNPGENVLSRTGRKEQRPAELASVLMQRWMGSPPHRKNILRRTYTHLGVCVMQDGDEIRATQSFARVRGWVSPPLPSRVSAGTTVPMTVTPVPRHRLTASKYDLWSPDTKRRVAGPRALAGTLHVPDTLGTFRVRFYFPESDRYEVHSGPAVTVVPPAHASPSPPSQGRSAAPPEEDL